MEPAMQQPRRWAMALAAMLMAASLAFAPREGSAGPAGRRDLLKDPPLTQEMGGPEDPPTPGPLISYRVWIPSVLLARGFQFDLAMVLGIPRCSAGTRLARCTLRQAARS
jgi:hypothetical protein